MSGTHHASRLQALWELGKFKLFDMWLGSIVALAFACSELVHSAGSTLAFVLAWVVLVSVTALTCSLDDIAGLRDGVDEKNHSGTARFGVQKPLLDGRLSVRDAIRFCLGLTAVVVLGTAMALGVAPDVPAWLLPLHVGVCLAGINYSWGLKLSYYGVGGIAVAVFGAGTVILPYAFACAHVPAIVWLSAALVGLWLGQIVMFSNTKDAAGDRAAGRMTIAARTSEAGNVAFIASVYALGWLLSVVAVWNIGPGWLLLALAPIWIAQGVQLHRGLVRRDWLGARRLGFSIMRLGCLTLALAGLVLVLGVGGI